MRAGRERMHSIMFALKRAHLTTVAAGQEAVAKVDGMTPARFDLLCLLRQASLMLPKGSEILRGMFQESLCFRLGLHPSTISKMLKRLEEMGWITRERDFDDRRKKVVFFTALGLRRAWRAMRRVFRGRLFLKPFEELSSALVRSDHPLDAVTRVLTITRNIATYFGDYSTVHYNYGRIDRRPGEL